MTLPELVTQYTPEELATLPPELADWLAPTPDGCLVWIGRRNVGYGQPGHTQGSAHILVWEHIRGPRPMDGDRAMDLGHTCHDLAAATGQCKGGEWCPHRACVLHVELQDRRTNMQRSARAQATHCVRGHEWTEDNIYRPPSRPHQRVCQACRKERALERRLDPEKRARDLARQRAWYQRWKQKPEHQGKQAARVARWRKANPEAERAIQQRAEAKRPDRREYHREQKRRKRQEQLAA